MAQPRNRRIKCIFGIAVALPLAAVLMAPPLSARIIPNTIDPIAKVADNGRRVIVTGPIGCTETQRADLRVTVTQRSTGAVAEGRATITCTTTQQQWEVQASVQGKSTFEEGPATVVALGTSASGQGDADDAHQWLVNVTLERQ